MGSKGKLVEKVRRVQEGNTTESLSKIQFSDENSYSEGAPARQTSKRSLPRATFRLGRQWNERDAIVLNQWLHGCVYMAGARDRPNSRVAISSGELPDTARSPTKKGTNERKCRWARGAEASPCPSRIEPMAARMCLHGGRSGSPELTRSDFVRRASRHGTLPHKKRNKRTRMPLGEGS